MESYDDILCGSCDPIMWSSADDSDDGAEDEEHDQPLVNLKDKLRELTETHDLVLKHGHAMLRQLAELEGDKGLPPAGAVAKVKEKIAMFKLTTGAMMKVCTHTENYIRYTSDNHACAVLKLNDLLIIMYIGTYIYTINRYVHTYGIYMQMCICMC